MRRLLLLCLTAMATWVMVLPVASAQGDDWSVRRDPFDKAVIARYKRILAQNPGDKAALRNLTTLYKRYRSVAQLIGEYERALAEKPNDFAAASILGHLHTAEGQNDKALGYYEKAAALRPESAMVQAALAGLYRAGGDVAKARAAYERALTAGARPAEQKEILKALADIALGQKDIQAARGYYERYFTAEPKDVQARIELGDALTQHGEHRAAIEVYTQAERKVRSDPAQSVDLIARIGAAYEAAGDDASAIREYRRAMDKVGRGYYLRKELTTRVIDIHRRRQSLGELLADYEKRWPSGNRDHFEWETLARLYEETGDQEKALTAYRQATKKAPYELDTQRRLIALLENSGRDDEALSQYEAVIRVAPGEPRFQLELAERYWRRGQESKALALLTKIESRFPTDAGVHSGLADLYTRWGKPDLALAAHVRLTRIEPEDIEHLVNLGEQYFQRNDKKKAEATWKRIITRKTPENYAQLGEVYAEHDMTDEALGAYSRAIKLDPKNPEYYKGRAGVYQRRRRSLSLAVKDWEEVLKLTEDNAANKAVRHDARRQIVSLLIRSGEIGPRQREWRQAFGQTPRNLEAGYFLAESFLREQKYPNAREILEKILAAQPEDSYALHELVNVYRHEGQYDQAIEILMRLAKLTPGRSREYYTQIAEIKTNQRKDTEAIEWITKALESTPNDPVTYQRLAERYETMQDFAKAISAYRRVIELDKRNFRAYFALATLYINNNAPDKAAELYREVLVQAGDVEVVSKAGQEAIALEEMTGTLGELERVVAPLAFSMSHKTVYRRILVELYDRYVPHLVRQWRRGDAKARASARAELDRLGAHGLKPLLEALNDESDVAQQRIAVTVLGYLGNQGAAAPLVHLAKKPSAVTDERQRIGTLIPILDWDVRVEALVAAGRLGDPRAIDDLTELSRHREKAMREAALFALGRTGHRDALPPLIQTLTDAGTSMQTLSCLGLAQIGDRQVVDSVMAVVADRKNGDIARGACAFALGYLGDPRAVPVLLDTLAHGNGEAQRLAAWSLGRIGDRRAVPALLSAYFSRHERVREAVLWALHRLAGPASAEGAAKAGAGKAGTAKAGAAKIGAAKAESPKAESFDGVVLGDYPMKRTTYDDVAAVQALPGSLELSAPSAAVILGHEAELALGLGEALDRHRDVVLRMLSELDEEPGHLSLGRLTAGLDRLPAARQKQVRDAVDSVALKVLPKLIELTTHRDPAVRSRALAVVAKVPSEEGKAALLKGLDDRAESVSSAAMDAVATYVALHGKFGRELGGMLAAKLGHESWQTRAHAAKALGRLGNQADQEALVKATRDPHAYVREAAVAAIGGLGERRLAGAVIALAGDASPQVRLAVVRALRDLGGEEAARKLTEMAEKDASDEVKEAARRALKTLKN